MIKGSTYYIRMSGTNIHQVAVKFVGWFGKDAVCEFLEDCPHHDKGNYAHFDRLDLSCNRYQPNMLPYNIEHQLSINQPVY